MYSLLVNPHVLLICCINWHFSSLSASAYRQSRRRNRSEMLIHSFPVRFTFLFHFFIQSVMHCTSVFQILSSTYKLCMYRFYVHFSFVYAYLSYDLFTANIAHAVILCTIPSLTPRFLSFYRKTLSKITGFAGFLHVRRFIYTVHRRVQPPSVVWYCAVIVLHSLIRFHVYAHPNIGQSYFHICIDFALLTCHILLLSQYCMALRWLPYHAPHFSRLGCIHYIISFYWRSLAHHPFFCRQYQNVLSWEWLALSRPPS